MEPGCSPSGGPVMTYSVHLHNALSAGLILALLVTSWI